MRLHWPTRRGILRRLAVLALLAVWLGAATAIEKGRLHATLPGGARGAANVDEGQLLEDARRLSAPDMEGRQTGTEGNARARAYIVQRLRDERIDRPFYRDVADLVASLVTQVDGRLDEIASHRHP
ncbi:MAG TPA: hypothetical protein VFS78_07840 [Vicinamibacteria bacterium]|nr:hypothetical protein [Vicinamibacteria bacterium]